MGASDRLKEAYDYFIGRGWSSAQAAGIVGNLHFESGGLNTDAKGDFMGGQYTAFGLAQWRGDRLANFQRLFGKPVERASFQEQLQFVDWELRNTEKSAGRALGLETTVEGATRTFMRLFERPSKSAATNTIGARTQAAQAAAGNGPNVNGASSDWNLTDPSTWSVPSMSDLDPTGISQYFTKDFAARVASVVVGVILIALAIAAFVLLSDKGKDIVAVAAKAA